MARGHANQVIGRSRGPTCRRLSACGCRSAGFPIRPRLPVEPSHDSLSSRGARNGTLLDLDNVGALHPGSFFARIAGTSSPRLFADAPGWHWMPRTQAARSRTASGSKIRKKLTAVGQAARLASPQGRPSHVVRGPPGKRGGRAGAIDAQQDRLRQAMIDLDDVDCTLRYFRPRD
jgi:hypothetical protein